MLLLSQYAPGLWLAEADLGDFQVRCAVLAGDVSGAVWDTLAHPRDMAALLPLLADKEFSVVYSHADWDHAWGAAGLEAAGKGGGPQHVVAHAHAQERFIRELPGELGARQQEEPGKWDRVRLVAPTKTIEQVPRLDLGGLSLELEPLDGHTPDSVVGFVPELGALLAGDAVEWPLPCVPAHCPLDAWIAGLERWQAHAQVSRVIPSHGPLGGKELIRATIKYLNDLSAGLAPSVPPDLTPFYARTHQDNLRAAGIL